MKENEEELMLLSPCKYSITYDGTLLEREQSLSLSGLSCHVTSGGAGAGKGYGANLLSNDTNESLMFFSGTILDLEWGEDPTPEQFDALFSLGEHEYTIGGDEGFQVTYNTPEEVTWSSDMGTAEQVGSRLEILEKVSETVSGSYVINMRVNFSCNLYNDGGEVKKCAGTATFVVEAF